MDWINWVSQNWDTIAGVGTAVLTIVSLIVAATDTKEDDAWLKRVLQTLSFLKPNNIPGLLSLPGVRPKPPGGAESPEDQGAGRGVGGVLVLALILALGPENVACGGGVQRVLNTGATVTTQLSSDAVPFYDAKDSQCREAFPPLALEETPDARAQRRDEYDACMTPVERTRTARAVLDRLLRAAQAAYDSAGEEGFRAKAPCLLAAAEQLLRGVTELTDQIPPELPDLIAFLRPYINQGDSCNDDLRTDHGNRGAWSAARASGHSGCSGWGREGCRRHPPGSRQLPGRARLQAHQVQG